MLLITVNLELLKQGFHKLHKSFSKFYRRYYDLISKFNIGTKSLLHQGLLKPEFYGDLEYKFKNKMLALIIFWHSLLK